MEKKALVTGADGFIGSHLVEALVGQGFKVKALVYYNSFNSWGWLDTLPQDIIDQIEIVSGDIRDQHMMSDIVKGQNLVFHLAALIAIPYSYAAPESYIDTNIKGTLNVLQAARDAGVERILVTSTSEVYGTARYVPIDELHPFQGQSPYSASKIAADRMAEAFHCSYSLPVTIVRPFNTYGPRQSSRAIIPTIISQLLAGASEIKLGALTPTRDFNFVMDTVNGFLEIAASEKTIGEEINIATGSEISIGDMANKLINKINPAARIVCEQQRIRPEKSEVDRLNGSNKKIKSLTAWTPRYSLDQGLDITIDWIKGNISHYKTNIYNL